MRLANSSISQLLFVISTIPPLLRQGCSSTLTKLDLYEIETSSNRREKG